MSRAGKELLISSLSHRPELNPVHEAMQCPKLRGFERDPMRQLLAKIGLLVGISGTPDPRALQVCADYLRNDMGHLSGAELLLAVRLDIAHTWGSPLECYNQLSPKYLQAVAHRYDEHLRQEYLRTLAEASKATDEPSQEVKQDGERKWRERIKKELNDCIVGDTAKPEHIIACYEYLRNFDLLKVDN